MAITQTTSAVRFQPTRNTKAGENLVLIPFFGGEQGNTDILPHVVYAVDQIKIKNPNAEVRVTHTGNGILGASYARETEGEAHRIAFKRLRAFCVPGNRDLVSIFEPILLRWKMMSAINWRDAAGRLVRGIIGTRTRNGITQVSMMLTDLTRYPPLTNANLGPAKKSDPAAPADSKGRLPHDKDLAQTFLEFARRLIRPGLLIIAAHTRLPGAEALSEVIPKTQATVILGGNEEQPTDKVKQLGRSGNPNNILYAHPTIGTDLGVLAVWIDSRNQIIDFERWDIPYTDLPRDLRMAQKIAEIQAQYKEEGERVIGHNSVEFENGRVDLKAATSWKESNLLGFIANAMATYLRAHGIMVDGVGVHSNWNPTKQGEQVVLPLGEITNNMVYDIIPNYDPVPLRRCTVAQFKALLETLVSDENRPQPNLSEGGKRREPTFWNEGPGGFQVLVDWSRESGDRVQTILYDNQETRELEALVEFGQVIDPKRTLLFGLSKWMEGSSQAPNVYMDNVQQWSVEGVGPVSAFQMVQWYIETELGGTISNVHHEWAIPVTNSPISLS